MRKRPGWTVDRVKALLKGIHARPGFGSRIDLDQCPATPSTIIRRLTLLGRQASSILLLGDDDLLSLALALTEARKKIAVVEIDGKLLQLIGSNSARSTIELLKHDLVTGIPPLRRMAFDEVFTDPPYTLAGQLLFVRRALAALRPIVGVSLYLCSSSVYLTSREVATVRSFLSHAGFGLKSAYPRFNCYKAPPDVRKDLRERGFRCTTWLYSDVFHFTRRMLAPIPRLPRTVTRNIYEYPS